jgi:hypothetical protein
MLFAAASVSPARPYAAAVMSIAQRMLDLRLAWRCLLEMRLEVMVRLR